MIEELKARIAELERQQGLLVDALEEYVGNDTAPAELNCILQKAIAALAAVKAAALAQVQKPDTEAATTANAFRNKDTHEIRYVLSNEHNEAEWEDVVITPASMSVAGQKGGE